MATSKKQHIVLRPLILRTAAAAGRGATMAGAHEPVETVHAVGNTITIECGGYDAEGNVVNAEAVDIGVLEVSTDDKMEVPEVCGGYTADGTFIGDD
ncbi:MAG: hypothetical protein R3320_08815 [Nitriliruptorales bacterium]|nr:hypothetical protein [Nitriliruptorales bacterium]